MAKKEFYTGIVVEESLEDSRILNEVKILKVKITDSEEPAKRWHVYTVKVSQKEIERLAGNIRHGWYMHFWKNKIVSVFFKGQRFELDHDEESSWTPAIQYGLFMGIPREQLNFPIE